MANPAPAYRILKISDPRSRGACYWLEIEAVHADGTRYHVATCDDRREARELVAAMEREHERRAAEPEKNS